MKVQAKLLLLVAVLVVCTVSADKWAVLIAGSNSWFNYRHQADVYNAYQALIKRNFNPDRIITFAYDDIASNSRNPFPGKVFNKPTYEDPGVDVYAGVKIDYKGADVTPQVFMDVIEGKKDAVKGKGTERVLEATSADNVFMFFSDHGGPGLIAFPSKYLYADDMLASFARMKGNYNKFVFYLESCESGSMFTKLPTDTKIYGLSAANPTESSWGTYCSPNDVIQGKHIGTCLGDLFSVNFVEDLYAEDPNSLSLNQQFEKIKNETNLSHVMQWGDQSFADEKVGNFVSGKKSLRQRIEETPIFRFKKEVKLISNLEDKRESAMGSRMMKIRSLIAINARENTDESFNEMKEEITSMQFYNNFFGQFNQKMQVGNSYNPEKLNFDCLRASIDTFEARCEKFTDFGMTYMNSFAEACEKHSTERILEEIRC